MELANTAPKPRLRGVLHEIAFYVSLVSGPILVVVARAGTQAGVAVYAAGMSALFGVSALYHRPNWGRTARRWLGRLDHTAIMVFIAATFTPIAVSIGTPWARLVLVLAWVGALVATGLGFLPFEVPKSVAVIPSLALGWLGVSLMPQAAQRIGAAIPVLLLLGGIAYTLGALSYARRAPDPRPGIFGYHEVFHSLVVLAAYLHYAAVAAAVT